MKRIGAVWICLLLVISGASLIGSTETGVEGNITLLPVDHIEVKPNPVNVTVGDTQQFTATAYDEFNVTIPGVDFIWSTDVGSVDATGFFFAQTTPGIGYVNATNGTVTGTANLTVVNGDIDHIIITPDPISISVGVSIQFYAYAYDMFNNIIPSVVFNWSCTGGIINETGYFTCTNTSCSITVTAMNGTISCTIFPNVIVEPIDYIVVVPDPVTITVGDSQQFTATAYDEYANEIPGVGFDWLTDVGSIDATGFFTAQSVPGVGMVTATNGTITGAATVLVEPGLIDHIIVIPNPVTIVAGETQQFTATAYDEYNNVILGVDFNWTTNIWNETGWYILPPGEPGWINATNGTVTGSANVTILYGSIDHIILTPDPVSVIVGMTQQFTATAYNMLNANIPGIGFSWSSNVGVINSTGFFTAQGTPGNGTVTATNGNVSGFANVTVTQTFNIHISNSSDSNDWILMSFPNKVSGDPLIIVQDVLDEGGGLVTWDIITTYNATQGKWLTTSTFKPPSLNTFNFVKNHMTFWIHVTNYGDGIVTIEGDLPTSGEQANIPLKAGWNLVGYPSLTNETVANALWGTGADKVEVCDPAEPYNIKEVGPTYVMRPGEGYWIHVPADTVWVIDW